MRPKVFALCAAGLLLASVTHCAPAQDGSGSAPLISSGRPANIAAAGPAVAAPGARRKLSDDDPTGATRDHSARPRGESRSLSDESGIGDRSWTSTRTQADDAATQSSRSVQHMRDQDPTAARAPMAQRTSQTPSTSQTPTPLPTAPPNAEALRPVPPRDSPVPDGPWQGPQAHIQAQTATSDVQTAGGLPPASGPAHLRSHVAHAQFTSTTGTSGQPQRDGNSLRAEGDEHRPLKPPTAADTAATEKRSTGTVQMFVSVISSLLIVVGLLLGAAWCYRKATPNLSGSLPKQALQVLGRTQLAPRQQLILVRFGPKLVLMSNLQGEVRTLSEIVDPLEVDRICGMCESSQAGSISDSFRTVLHNIGRTG